MPVVHLTQFALGSPWNLHAYPGNQQASLHWSAPTGTNATGYYLYRNGSRIARTPSTSYVNTGLTNGRTYTYYAVAYNSRGTSAPSNTVSATPAAPVAVPVNIAPPTITGPTITGQQLTGSSGSWSNSPSSYSYQWYRCDSAGANCAAISGTTAPSYLLGPADVGHTITVFVTASNSAGSGWAIAPATAAVSGTAAASCTTTLSSLSQVNADLTPGAIVCLAAGTYGSLSITASPSSGATLTAAPGAHVVVAGVVASGSNLTISQLHSTGGIALVDGASHDTIDHNDVTNGSCGFGVGIFGAPLDGSPFTAVATNDVISGNTIHDTGSTCESDAIRVQGWANLTVTGNDIYKITNSQTACGGECHVDTLQSYNAGYATTGLVVTRNYVHDETDAQGLPFLKDGDISNVTISDNLDVRGSTALGGGEVTGITAAENTPGLTITNNTYQNTTGSLVEAYGTAANPSVNVSHNVFDQFNVQTNTTPDVYGVSENHNVFTDSNEWSFAVAPTDSVGSTPAFMCGANCGNGSLAGDDYRLASNPNSIGIDWAPASQVYGPSN